MFYLGFLTVYLGFLRSDDVLWSTWDVDVLLGIFDGLLEILMFDLGF